MLKRNAGKVHSEGRKDLAGRCCFFTIHWRSSMLLGRSCLRTLIWCRFIRVWGDHNSCVTGRVCFAALSSGALQRTSMDGLTNRCVSFRCVSFRLRSHNVRTGMEASLVRKPSTL